MQAEPRQKIPILQNRVVFSKNYLPLARINIKQAIVLLIRGQTETLQFSSIQAMGSVRSQRRTTNPRSHPFDE